jgi:hypothetical protein
MMTPLRHTNIVKAPSHATTNGLIPDTWGRLVTSTKSMKMIEQALADKIGSDATFVVLQGLIFYVGHRWTMGRAFWKRFQCPTSSSAF